MGKVIKNERRRVRLESLFNELSLGTAFFAMFGKSSHSF